MGRSATALMGTAGAILLGLFAAQAIPTRPSDSGNDWRDRYGASDKATEDYAAQGTDFFSDNIAIPSGPPAWLFGDDPPRLDIPAYTTEYASYADDYGDGAISPASYAEQPQVADRADDAANAAARAAQDVQEAEAQPAEAAPPPSEPAPIVAVLN